MSIFEAQVETIRSLIKSHVKEPLAVPDVELPTAKAQAGLILQSESICELGGPKRISALSLTYTNNCGKEGAFRIGMALGELPKQSADFALAVILGGEKINAEIFYQFTLRFPRLADHPNWMVKTDKSTIWVRVGGIDTKDSLEVAAASLIDRIHNTFDAVESVELYFIVQDKVLIEQLAPVAKECQKLMRDVKAGVWRERGFDYESCELAGHCGSCSDKKTCASIRKIQAKVKLVRKVNTKEL